METIETKAAKLGLDRGYYLLLMAILDKKPKNTKHTKLQK